MASFRIGLARHGRGARAANPAAELTLLVVALTACGHHRDTPVASTTAHAPAIHDAGIAHPEALGRAATGMFWGRLADVPPGMRVQVWLESDGTRVRGSYSATPWNGDIEGTVRSERAVELTLLERGMTRTVGDRTRHAVLQWDAVMDTLAGDDEQGSRIELLRAGFGSPALREGLWISHWTGLPFGMGVETRIHRDPDGHWRAVYQYQGTGGVRDGSFDGTLDARGDLAILWREVNEAGAVASGHGRLSPTPFGLRGTFGIENTEQGTGEWTIEPLGF